jgi:hypothetical protein
MLQRRLDVERNHVGRKHLRHPVQIHCTNRLQQIIHLPTDRSLVIHNRSSLFHLVHVTWPSAGERLAIAERAGCLRMRRS